MYDRLVAANTKFALGLTIGAPEVWSTSYRLAKTDAEAASNGQSVYFPRNPFDADLRGATGIMDEPTTLFLVPAELGTYDSDMAGLGEYLCDTGFMAPPNIGAPDAPAIYGKFYCSASDLAAKRAGSSGDGHQATCQAIAQRWSAKGVALPAAGSGQPAVNGPVTPPFPPVAPQLPTQPAQPSKPAQPSQGGVQNQSLEARCKATGAAFKDGQCAFSDGTIVKFPN